MDLLSSSEAAALLPDTSVQSLLRWAREGKVNSIQLPDRRRFFRRDDIEKLLTPQFSEVSESSHDSQGFADVPLPSFESGDESE